MNRHYWFFRFAAELDRTVNVRAGTSGKNHYLAHRHFLKGFAPAGFPIYNSKYAAAESEKVES